MDIKSLGILVIGLLSLGIGNFADRNDNILNIIGLFGHILTYAAVLSIIWNLINKLKIIFILKIVILLIFIYLVLGFFLGIISF
jgi:hypothetical protein